MGGACVHGSHAVPLLLGQQALAQPDVPWLARADRATVALQAEVRAAAEVSARKQEEQQREAERRAALRERAESYKVQEASRQQVAPLLMHHPGRCVIQLTLLLFICLDPALSGHPSTHQWKSPSPSLLTPCVILCASGETQ